MLVAILSLLASCRYKDLCYDHSHFEDNNVWLQLSLVLDQDTNLDVSTAAHTKIEVPTVMVVQFYDTLTGALRETEYVGPYGGRLQVAPGTYNMVVYSFDTEWTWVRGENNVSSLEAYTSDITAMKSHILSYVIRNGKDDAPGPIIYTPDHLLVAQQVVHIPAPTLEQPVVIIKDTASTVIETYGFEVTNINGIEYIASVDAFVTNQARSTFFGRGEKNTEPATVYFPLEANLKEKKLKTTFNTFGKLPGESYSYLHIVVTDMEGKIYTVTSDITEQFNNTDRIIEIDEPIEIPKPEGGGIAPTVEPWDEEIHDVPIG